MSIKRKLQMALIIFSLLLCAAIGIRIRAFYLVKDDIARIKYSFQEIVLGNEIHALIIKQTKELADYSSEAAPTGPRFLGTGRSVREERRSWLCTVERGICHTAHTRLML